MTYDLANAISGSIKGLNTIFSQSPSEWNGALNTIGQGVNKVTGNAANNEFNAIEAQKQRDWEERMSNTQYQRTVADMQAAGINPASLMSGASLTTLGSSSSATSGAGTNVISPLLNAITGIAKAISGGTKVSKVFNFIKK